MTTPTGASAAPYPNADLPDGATQRSQTASAAPTPMPDNPPPPSQPLQPAEPLPGASASPPVGTLPGMIHPDVWAVLDHIVETGDIAGAARLVDRTTDWMKDHLRNAATKREIQRRAAYQGDIVALQMRARLRDLALQDESRTVAVRAAIHLDQSGPNQSGFKRGIPDTVRGKSVVVVLNRRSRVEVGMSDASDGDGDDEFTVHVTSRRRAAASAGEVIEAEAGEVQEVGDDLPVVTPKLLRAAVRAGLDDAAIGDGDEPDPDEQ